MTGRLALSALLLPLLFLVTANAEPKPLEGFRLEGTRWTYEGDGLKMSGILLKPEGDGPFPAVLISHGKGGRAEGFGESHGRVLVGYGLVCIAPTYTHAAGEVGGPRTDGASTENIKRARKCLDILENLPYVDKHRLGAYGHSMGGFVTIGLAAVEPRLKAAAITGSGISPQEGYAAPSAAQAGKIRIPFLMMHGEADNTVRPSQSAALKEVLDGNKVPTEYHTYPGEGHPIDRTQGTEVHALIRKWFERHGVLKPSTGS